MTKQFETLLVALSSSQSFIVIGYGPGSRRRGGGRNAGGRGKKKCDIWNGGGDHLILQCSKTVLKAQEKNDTHVSLTMKMHLCLSIQISKYLRLPKIQMKYIFKMKCQI